MAVKRFVDLFSIKSVGITWKTEGVNGNEKVQVDRSK